MKKFGIALLLIALISFTFLLISGFITKGETITLGVIFLFASLILILGPETITEITLWKASIKRDVNAAKEIRAEVEQIRTQLRSITKVIVENAYILSSISTLAMGGEQAARSRIKKNMEELSIFAEPIKEDEEKWWNELQELFSNRKE